VINIIKYLRIILVRHGYLRKRNRNNGGSTDDFSLFFSGTLKRQ
jgi:hypothetical protein